LVDIAFLSAGAAERDRSIRLAAQRVDTGELNTRYLPDRDDPGLSVIAPVVDPIDDEALQQRSGLRERDATTRDVAGVLRRIELDREGA